MFLYACCDLFIYKVTLFLDSFQHLTYFKNYTCIENKPQGAPEEFKSLFELCFGLH